MRTTSMKSTVLHILLIVFGVSACAVVISGCTRQAASPSTTPGVQTNTADGSVTNGSENINAPGSVANETNITPAAQPDFVAPISDALSRITKKPFGIYVTPQDSPVQPERFSGYHTGVDFETTDAEADADVPITAACDGAVRVKRRVSGYGGVVIQDCTLDGQAVTVLYGHLNIDSVSVAVGDTLQKKDFIGNLGQGYSQQTDGERKHLHLGIHAGTGINYKGYVATQAELSGWLDARHFLQ